MAGDWIKMRTALAHDPAVIAIALDLDKNEFEVVGMLHHIWSWADSQSQDGHIKRVTEKWLDRFVHCDGFSKSLAAAKWLIIGSDGIEFPNFGKHNGESAKKRAEAAERQRVSRELKAIADAALLSQKTCDESVTREEKRREEDKELPPLAPQGEKKKTKRSIPEPFMVTAEMRLWAAESVPAVSVKAETENFCDYWRGAGGTKLDWVATWRTWMRKAQKDSQGGGRGGYKPFNKQAAVEENNERVVQEIIAREKSLSGTNQNLFDTGDTVIIEGEFIHAH